MKNKVFIWIFLLVLGFSGCCSLLSPQRSALAFGGEDNFIIRSYGDSIASGEGLEGFSSYVLGTSVICEDSYPEVFSRNYLETFGGQVTGHAVSGDTTSDLLEILSPYIDGSAEDMSAFDDTDIVTLCIGANNVLGTAISSLPNFLTGSLSEEEYQALLNAGIARFKADYPVILDAFEGKKVAVMTVYNPYEYLTLNDISIHPSLTSFENSIKQVIAGFEVRLQRMLEMSMEALQIINDGIRQSASADVYVVDIWEMFEDFSKEDYLEYINSDMSKMVIDNTNLSAILRGDVSGLFSQFQLHCDPHPTKAGHEKIAEEHLNTFKYFKLSTLDDLSSFKAPEDKITLNISSIDLGNYTYKLYKNTETESFMISESTQSSIEISASEIEGKGNLMVEIYSNEQLIFTTNSLDYNIDLNTFTIFTDDNLSGVKDAQDQITINFNMTNSGEFSFKLIKLQNGVKTILSEAALDQYVLKAENIIGQGQLYIDIYQKTELVATTNSLDFNITLNSFSISMDKDWSDAVLDMADTVEISINALDYSNYYYKLFKYDVNGIVLLSEGEDIKWYITAQMLEGEGCVYVEVYKNNEKLYSTNAINYCVKLNVFEFSTTSTLSGGIKKGEVFEFSITSEISEQYTYKIFKTSEEGSVLLYDGAESLISLSAEQIDGKGELCVEVYKEGIKVSTTNKLSYDIVVANFTLASDIDFQTITDKEQDIVIFVDSKNVKNIEFKLLRETSEKTIAIQTNKTGRFALKAKQLEGSGSLYVEVYSNGELFMTTNRVDYSLSFVEKEIETEQQANWDSLVIYFAVGLIGLLALIGGIIVITRVCRRKSF